MTLFKGEIIKCAEVETHIFQSQLYFFHLKSFLTLTWIFMALYFVPVEPLFKKKQTNMCLCICSDSEELDKFMESQGASAPGILTLTTSLSKPFMRLDKYPTLLQELERHVEVLDVFFLSIVYNIFLFPCMREYELWSFCVYVHTRKPIQTILTF